MHGRERKKLFVHLPQSLQIRRNLRGLGKVRKFGIITPANSFVPKPIISIPPNKKEITFKYFLFLSDPS